MNQVLRARSRTVAWLQYALGVAPVPALGWQVAFPSSDSLLISGVLIGVAFIMLARLATLEIRQKRLFARRVLILGTGPLAAKLMTEIGSSPDPRYVVAGVVDDERPKFESWANNKWLGPFGRLAQIVEKARPARIVVALHERRGHLPLKQLLESRVHGIVVEDALEFFEHLTGKIAIEALTPGALIFSKGFQNHGTTKVAARAVSVAAAAVGLVLLSPLLAAIAVAIVIDSRGPVLFLQKRAGKDGRPFQLLKFRTMHPCDKRSSEWVRDNADRITRVGKWLRRFRLDELPQLVNILRGEMNLVGPRPHPTCNQRIFVERIAYYGLRSTVLPGLTGWAQIRYGYANNIEEETEKMRYDLYYIKNQSLWLDVKILLQTVATMLRGHGAAEVRRWTSSRSEAVGPRGYAPAKLAPCAGASIEPGAASCGH